MAKPEAPVDDLTHFPLLFISSPDLPPVPVRGDRRYDPMVVGYHHTVFSDIFDEEADAGSQAAHDACLQWMFKDDHRAYHKKWGGLDAHYPNTRLKQYQIAALGLAEYVPKYGIDFSRSVPRLMLHGSDGRNHLRRSGQLCLGNDGVRMRRFLLDFSFEQGAGAANANHVEEFLALASTQNNPLRLQILSEILLRQTVDPILTPDIERMYSLTKKREMLRPGTPSSLGSLIMGEIRSAFTKEGFVKILARKFFDLRLATT